MPPKAKKKAQSSKNATRATAEVTRLGGALRTLGGLGGSALGSLIGMGPTGASYGTGLGAALSKWLGSGDYTVSSNTITQKASAGSIPAMHKEGQSILVRHREFLTEIRGATSFTVRNEFDLNPGLSTTFPWLASIAAQYSQYRIKGLVYHYVPTSGNAVSSTNAALGTVMLQTSYRATESAPTSKIEMLNEYWSSEAKPSEEFCHPIECDPKENPFNVQYVRTGNLPLTENQLMYDLGRTVVAVSGQQADNVVLGDLWITYEIELKKPVLTNLTNTDIQTFGSTSVSNIAAATPLGSDMSTKFSSFIENPSASGSTLTFPRSVVGSYQVTAYWDGVTATGAGTISITGGTLISVIANSDNTVSLYSVGVGKAMATFFVTVPDPDVAAVVTFTLATLTAPQRCRLLITEINPAVRVDT